MDNMIYTMKTYAGNSIQSASQEAKDMAIEKGATIEFEFNGIRCLVNSETNVDYLVRDFLNTYIMDWKEVGPDCAAEYSPSVAKELAERTEQQRIEQEARQKELAERDAKEKTAFELKVAGIQMDFADEKGWQDGRAKNTDPYGNAIYEYAEGWARLMQKEMAKGKKLEEIASPTSYELGFLGISGFMYGAAVSVLSYSWKHGEELRKWHNGEYNHTGDGVVNPAILTINK